MLHTASALAVPRVVEGSSIQDRYRVERVLGRGGMGEVLAVHDTSTGNKLALKRLLPGAKPRHVMLLQREYHTLVSLSHPHVVQAYDYGTNEGAPFYTMELLSGSDVEALAPLPWPQVATILHDVASALALLHARQLVHRDVTARNVWRTQDGEIKLIDFGTLSSVGEARDVAGTPPYVAPEVLRTRVLDQRTDLYSLGALGYFLLTGRHAFGARALVELEQYWADDFKPLAERLRLLARDDLPELPAALEQLIDSLLEHEPDARPSSAADLIDRLAVLLPDTQMDRPATVRGVLASKAFVGRELELKRLRTLLKQTTSGLGTSAVLLSAPGGGRTRLLAELSVEARVAGATVLSVRSDGDPTPLAAAARCSLKLLESLPSSALEAARSRAAALGHVSAELRERLGLSVEQLEKIPETAGEARMRVHAALSGWWLDVARTQPLVILLDGLEELDESSAALFAALSRELGSAHLLLVAAVCQKPGAEPSRVVQAFVDKAFPLPLTPLTQAGCKAMLGSMFGDVEHLARTAQRLVELAEGSPGRIVELAEHLVRSGLARYSDGSWVLPQDIGGMDLPSSRGALDEARLLALSADARTLAVQLSVSDDQLSLEQCARLTKLGPAPLFAALAELVSANILLGSEDGYRFRRNEQRTLLLASLSEEERRLGHASLADSYLGIAEPTLFERAQAGLHLLHSGDVQQGLKILNLVAHQAVVRRSDEQADVSQCLEQALLLLRPYALSDHELLPLLCALTTAGFFVEQRLAASYGEEALERAGRALGVQRARRLRRYLGRKLALYVALFCAAIVFRRKARKRPAVLKFADSLRMFVSAAGSLTGVNTVCIAREGALRAAQAIEPLSALGPNHVASVVHDFSMCLSRTVNDRLGDAARHWQRLLQRLDDPLPIKGCDDHSRMYYRCGALYAYGATECWRDDSRALEIADQLEQQPMMLYRLSAEQLRALYYGHQGDSQRAAHHRALVEVRALQRGVTWQVEIWNPSGLTTVAARQHDAMTAKRSSEQLRHLSKEVPSLLASVHTARAAYLLLRERYAEAVAAAKQAREQRDPHVVGATNGLAQLAQAYNGAGKHNKARDVCLRALANKSSDDLSYAAMAVRCQIELAHAESGLGNHKLAGEQLDALLALHAPRRGPLTLGALHEARALVAKRAEDEPLAEQHFAEMDRWYRGTGCATLVQHCDRIGKQQGRRRGRRGELGDEGGRTSVPGTGDFTSLDTFEGPSQLLAPAMRAATASDGLLCSFSAGEVICLGKSNDNLPAELQPWLETRVRASLSYSTETEDSEDAPVDQNTRVCGGKSWHLWLLTVDDEVQGQLVVGAIALADAMRPLSPELLARISGRLVNHRSQAVSSWVSVS